MNKKVYTRLDFNEKSYNGLSNYVKHLQKTTNNLLKSAK